MYGLCVWTRVRTEMCVGMCVFTCVKAEGGYLCPELQSVYAETGFFPPWLASLLWGSVVSLPLVHWDYRRATTPT